MMDASISIKTLLAQGLTVLAKFRLLLVTTRNLLFYGGLVNGSITAICTWATLVWVLRTISFDFFGPGKSD